MMTHTQVELLDTLAELCEILPEHRFAQMLCNLTSFVELVPESTWTVSDDLLLVEAERFLDTQRQRFNLGHGAHPASRLSDPVRRELLVELRKLFEHAAGESLGRIIAELVRRGLHPTSTQDLAGALWDIDDADLLSLVRAELTSRSMPDARTASGPTTPVKPT
jgi:hypothetical protein